jgi:Bacterial regulatory proteins, tetR family
MKLASSDARKLTAFAISSGVAPWPAGVLDARTSNISHIAALAGARVGPGATVLTRTPAPSPRRLTPNGLQTRQRIVDAAANLIFEQGVAHTTIEDVRAAADVSSSQLYHYFDDKPALSWPSSTTKPTRSSVASRRLISAAWRDYAPGATG